LLIASNSRFLKIVEIEKHRFQLKPLVLCQFCDSGSNSFILSEIARTSLWFWVFENLGRTDSSHERTDKELV
jgi:hypothetical protein